MQIQLEKNYTNPSNISTVEKAGWDSSVLRSSQEKFDLFLTEKVMNKADYLCKKIPDKEWSGILFFTVKNSVKDVSNLKITAIDLFPMDIGTSSYTEFLYHPDLAGYVADNIDLMGAHMGLIHSHNNMNVFFSGTDVNTLQEQAPLYKIFLSVIVNNRMDVDAALAIHAKSEITSHANMVFQDFDFKPVNRSENLTSSKDIVFKYSANIIKSNDIVEKDFVNIVSELLNNQEKHSHLQRMRSNENVYERSYGNGGYGIPPKYTSLPNNANVTEKSPELPDDNHELDFRREILAIIDNLTMSNLWLGLSDSEMEDIPKCLNILNTRIGRISKKALSIMLDERLLETLDSLGYGELSDQYQILEAIIEFLGSFKNKYVHLSEKLLEALMEYLEEGY